MPFLTLSNANVQFVKKELKWRSYIIIEVLSTTKRVELVNKREFTSSSLDENIEMFVIYIATLLTAPAIQVHLSCQA